MENIFVEFLPPWVETGLQPAFYDKESGTVLQQTARMYSRVNMLIRMFNKLSKSTKTTVEEYIAKFNELYDYVHDYFDNLDVQDEIDHKLDEMSEDGTLQDIIYEYLDTYYRNQPLVKEYVMNTVIACPYIGWDNAGFGMQGGCVLPDGNIIQYTGDAQTIQKWSPDGTKLLEVNSNYGHGNSMTYCDKTNTIFITSTQDAGLGRYMVYEINIATLTLVNSYDCSSKDFPGEPYGICYDSKNEKFIFSNYWQKNNIGSQYLWSTDLSFNVTDSKAFSFVVSGTSNLGMVFDSLGVLVIQNNEILEFDPDTLEYVSASHLKNKIGEVWTTNENEWFDTRNGKFYGGFLCGETNVYGVYDPDNAYEQTNLTAVFSRSEETYYVDYSADNPFRNGTQAAPFENITEAINASRNDDDFSGRVTIVLQNASASNQKVTFSGNKTFVLSQGGNIVCFGQLTVNQGTTLMATTPIIIQGVDGDTTSINISGTVHTDFIDTVDNSPLVIKGGRSGYIQAAFHYGLDVTDYKGTIECLSNGIGNASITGLSTSGFFVPVVKQYDLTLSPMEGETHKFKLPRMSHTMMLAIRYQDTEGTHEDAFPVTYGRYYNYIINAETTITINWDGTITLSSNTSNLRVIVNGV